MAEALSDAGDSEYRNSSTAQRTASEEKQRIISETAVVLTRTASVANTCPYPTNIRIFCDMDGLLPRSSAGAARTAVTAAHLAAVEGAETIGQGCDDIAAESVVDCFEMVVGRVRHRVVLGLV